MNIGAIIAATVLVAAVGLLSVFSLVLPVRSLLWKWMRRKLLFVRRFPVITAVAVVIPAVMVWQQRSPKVRHL